MTADITSSKTLDLWEIAKDLTLVPQGDSKGTRASRRLKPKQRRQNWALLIFSIITGSLCATGFWETAIRSTSSPPTLTNFLSFMGFYSALFLLAYSWGQLLNIDARRKVNIVIKRLNTPLRWILTLIAYLLAFVTCIASPLVLAYKVTNGDVSSLQANLVNVAIVGFGVCLLVPTFTESMLNANERKPKPGKGLGVLALSTLALCGVLFTAVTLIIQPDMKIELVALVSTAALTAFGAILAWHRHRLIALSSIRNEVLRELIEALRYVSDLNELSTFTRSLRRLQVLFEAGPFRSQSIAAPVLAASWEIRVVLQLMLWAWDEGKYPEAIQLRAKDPGSTGKFFPLPNPTTAVAVRSAAKPFLEQAYERLLASSVR